MHLLYNSDSYAVMQFEVLAPEQREAHPLSRGGFEIVDKFARKEIFIDGAVAESFKLDVEALIEGSPSEEDIDDYLERFTSVMQQPVVMH